MTPPSPPGSPRCTASQTGLQGCKGVSVQWRNAPLYWASVGAENTGRLAGCAACTQLVRPRPQAVAPQARFTHVSDLAWRNCGPRLEEEPIQLRTLARHRPGISDRAEPLGWPPVPPALVTDPSTPAPWSVRAGIGLGSDSPVAPSTPPPAAQQPLCPRGRPCAARTTRTRAAQPPPSTGWGSAAQLS